MAEPYEQETRWSMNRDQVPWLQIFIEGTAIVVSILLAFAIDAWWEKRGLLHEEQEILVGLNDEFIDVRDRLGDWIDHNRLGSQLINRFLSDEVEAMSREDIELMYLHAAVLVNVLDEGGMLNGLLASGRLELVSDRELRSRLGKWPDYIDDLRINDQSARTMAMQLIQRFLASQGIPRDVCEQGKFVCPDSEEVPREYLRLARNPEFRSLLIVRRLYMWHIADDHDAALREANEILQMIDRRLSEIGPAGR